MKNIFEQREYQRNAIRRIADMKVQRLGVQMPTGSGKTYVMGEVIKEWTLDDKRVLFVVDKVILVDQTINTFKSLGFEAERLQGVKKFNPKANVFVATRQGLKSKKIDGNFDYVIYDEVHGYRTSSIFRHVEEMYGNPKMVGLSATLHLPSGEPMGMFEDNYTPVTTLGLIEDGHLKDIEVLRVQDLTNELVTVQENGDDYKQDELESLMLTKDVVGKTEKYLVGKKTIVFATGIKHAELLVEQYTNRGFNALVYHSKLSEKERQASVRAMMEGELDIIIGVDALISGFDCPIIDTVVIARPTRSHCIYRQMVGRGLRKFATAKTCTIIDAVGVGKLLGHPKDPVSAIVATKKAPMAKCCPVCDSLDIRATDNPVKVESEMGELLLQQDHTCNTCYADFTTEEPIRDNICTECDRVITKKHSSFTETDTHLMTFSICPYCGYSNLVKSIELVDNNFEEIEYVELHEAVSKAISKKMTNSEILKVAREIAEKKGYRVPGDEEFGKILSLAGVAMPLRNKLVDFLAKNRNLSEFIFELL